MGVPSEVIIVMILVILMILGLKMTKKYEHNMTHLVHQVRHGRAVGGALQSCEYPSDVLLQMSCEVLF